MYWYLIVALLIVVIIAFFCWANYRTKREHATFTKNDVISAIENVLGLGNDDYRDEWDLFLNWPIEDPYLESVRQRCIAISAKYSDVEEGKDIASSGEAELHLILEELKG